MWPCGSEVHPALVQLCIAGFQGAAAVLPQHPAEHVHLISQEGELVEGHDGAPKVDLCLRDPAEVTQFPQFYVCSGEPRQDDAMQVGWSGEPLFEILFHPTALAVGVLKRVWLQLQY